MVVNVFLSVRVFQRRKYTPIKSMQRYGFLRTFANYFVFFFAFFLILHALFVYIALESMYF